MTLPTYDVGDTVRLSANYTDTGGNPHNPTSVKFVYRDPLGLETTISSPTNPSTGSYFTDLIPDHSGTWRWRSYSTGDLNTAEEAVFVVRKQWVGAST